MKHILITCDTEVGELAGDRRDAFEIFIEGVVNSKKVGVELINSIAAKYGAIVEHFVDVYPYEKYGEEKFETLCKTLIDGGHRIGLHTHPSGRYDKNRKFMWQYSLKEQTEIVRFGKQKIKEWVRLENISHRAGGYGADENTLIALKENNIFVDSSFFCGNDKCQIKYPYKNQVSLYKDIFEIPVTVYESKKLYRPFGIEKKKYQKLDFRYGSSSDEILEVIDCMASDSVIVIFLHSFNFLNLPYDFKTKQYANISINHNLINEYEKLLSSISMRKDCKFDYSLDVSNEFKMEDTTPKLVREESILKPIKQKIINKFSKRGNI